MLFGFVVGFGLGGAFCWVLFGLGVDFGLKLLLGGLGFSVGFNFLWVWCGIAIGLGGVGLFLCVVCGLMLVVCKL